MDITTNTTGLPEPASILQRLGLSSTTTVLLSVLTLLAFTIWWPGGKNEPPSLKGAVPFLSTTYLFLGKKLEFSKRMRELLRTSRIFQFRLGFKRVYVVSGTRNVEAVFRARQGIRDEIMMDVTMQLHWKLPKEDLAKWHKDRTGRGKAPSPGTESFPADERYWASKHQIYEQFLTSHKYATHLAAQFSELYLATLEQYPAGEWADIRLMDGLRPGIFESGVGALMGPRVMGLNPEFKQAFWAYEERLLEITQGLPRWMNPRPFELRDKLISMVGKWVDAAWDDYDWQGPDVDWEPIFGARISRELAKWFKENFSQPSQEGFFTGMIMAQNSNTLPTIMWAMMEVFRNAELLADVRAEIRTTWTTDPKTGARSIDIPKLLSLPLLQSIFTETMRVHMSTSIVRYLSDDVMLDGYRLRKGGIILMPIETIQQNEEIWGCEGHSASQFWGARHVKYEDKLDRTTGERVREARFAFEGRTSTYFPFGGGAAICPGRQFARQEIIMALGIFIARFDVEFVEWTTLSGEQSDRPALDDERYEGTAALPPDRDMRIRCKRLW